MRHRWRRFRELTPQDRALALEAVALLTLASLLLALVPFRQVARWLGDLDREVEGDTAPARARAIGRAVIRAAPHLPWHPLCLPQALAARAMLRRRGIPSTVYFGMRLEGPERIMQAHAWVTAGSTGVVGMSGIDRFTVLARYSR